MRELPTGTVTFLFTDIEGSTQLLHELGDRYAGVLAEHRRALREAFARYGGVEVDAQGDALFWAFDSAPNAVAAALEAQETLSASRVRVRIGLHTGNPQAVNGEYVGVDVHRGARIMAAGHGGQVLLSDSTRSILGRDVVVTDLGVHRLKDFAEPEKLYQLGAQAFPPLKTIDATNLPAPTSPLIGRQTEVAQLEAVLREGARLVTVTGAGGSGKTRLALHVAWQLVGSLPDGVFWAPLAGLAEHELVVPSIAQAVGARGALKEHLRGRRMLVLIDNAEHLLDAAPDVAHLLAAAPDLQLLVTSRAPLRIVGEREFRLDPLAVDDAAALFVARARDAGRDLAPDTTVHTICRRVDGLPLAIELAAARSKLLPPTRLLERLEEALPLLTSGARDAPERHRTLRATIDWSYDLLPPEVQDVFAKLGVFAGEFGIDAAEQVCDAELDQITLLVDFSLLKPVGDARVLLLETVREHARALLADRKDARPLHLAHAMHYVALAESAEPELRGAAQREWLNRLEAEHDNLRSALAWSRDNGHEDIALRMGAALWRFWCARNHVLEGSRTLESLVERGEGAPSILRARALRAASRLAREVGNGPRSAELGEEALSAARRGRAPAEVAAATENLGVALFLVDQVPRALGLLEEAAGAFRTLGDRVGTGNALNNLANVLLAVGEGDAARRALTEALSLQREAANAWGIGFALHTRGALELELGDVPSAEACFVECVQVGHDVADAALIADCAEGLAQVAAHRREDRRAVTLAAAGRTILAHRGQRTQGVAPDERWLADARTRLGRDTFDAAWLEGARFSADDVVSYVLGTATNGARNASAEAVSSR